ncbi:hypothetical protein [Carnobacterium maltaromaticum]|uniref:hypothetical protein n=1 Tax=Carnobacterium maltaromaticum TaxID=2751 RepID=UPI001D60C46B|nr:hypothetical protein [Carnobacterium maltaromaticum]MCC4310702.1 hypothetical protein [Carnobacterium maltaromaticum]
MRAFLADMMTSSKFDNFTHIRKVEVIMNINNGSGAQINNSNVDNIGSQVGEMKNSAIQTGNNSNFNLNDSDKLENQLNDLESYLKQNGNNELHIELLNEMRESVTTGDKSKFQKAFEYLQKGIGTVAQLASIAATVGLLQQ